MRSRRWIPILGLSLAAAALLTGLVFIAVGEEGALPPVEGADTVQRLYGGLDQDGPELGDPDAPVTISIFNDLQCTDCADYHLETVPPLIEGLVRQGDAKLEFRHRAVGLKVVTAAAVGAASAGLQDYEWTYAHLVFLNQESIEDTGRDRPVPRARRADDPGARVRLRALGDRPRGPRGHRADRVRRPDRRRPGPRRAGGRRRGPQRHHRARRFPLGLRHRGRGGGSKMNRLSGRGAAW